MPIWFDDSSVKRQKLARKRGVKTPLERSTIPESIPYELLTKEEIWNGPTRSFVYDVESYPNYFLIGFQCLDTNKIIHFEDSPEQQIDRDFLSFMLFRHLFIGFNSIPYDLPMVGMALKGFRAAELKEFSNHIIYGEEKREYSIELAKVNHIDLIEPLPLQGSLKLYGARCHAPRLQDLPYEHDRILTKEEALIVKDYNANDLDLTKIVYKELKPFLDLRDQLSIEYKTDVRSKSDSQIAETILLSEIRRTGQRVGKSPWTYGDTFKYTKPKQLQFQTPYLNEILQVVENCTFKIEASGYADTPKEITELNIRLGGNSYRMGNGGLHSQEKQTSFYSNKEFVLCDRDVASYYPNIKLKVGLYPKHIGPIYLEVYGDRIVSRRLAAKAAKRIAEADGLKITANGSFGKNGNIFSPLYAPDVLLHVTLSGQLFLLMFIESLIVAGFEVISANTDGVVTNVPRDRYNEFVAICERWELATGFVTEETQYRSLHSRDVNNYIVRKDDNKTKVKGVYSEVGSALNSILSKNPETLIISDALQAYICNGTSVDQTIRACNDIRRFVSVRNVRGGAEKNGQYLGKVVRWYYANGIEGTINYVLSGNSVAKTEGGKPCMILPTSIPDDLNYDWYINEAIDGLYDIGVWKRPEEARLI